MKIYKTYKVVDSEINIHNLQKDMKKDNPSHENFPCDHKTFGISLFRHSDSLGQEEIEISDENLIKVLQNREGNNEIIDLIVRVTFKGARLKENKVEKTSIHGKKYIECKQERLMAKRPYGNNHNKMCPVIEKFCNITGLKPYHHMDEKSDSNEISGYPRAIFEQDNLEINNIEMTNTFLIHGAFTIDHELKIIKRHDNDYSKMKVDTNKTPYQINLEKFIKAYNHGVGMRKSYGYGLIVIRK